MPELPFIETTVSRMDEEYEGRKVKARPYLGMSEIGDKCSRRLWIKFHTDFDEKFDGRMLRLFDTGYLIERRVVRDLKKAGFIVTGRQKRFRDFKGKFRGHCDGVVEGLVESGKPHVLEVKSCNAKSFKKFKEEGIEAHEFSGKKYYAQAQTYMGYAKLDRTLFIVENKDTSERYQERIAFNKEAFEALKIKAKTIIEAIAPPAGISERIDFWKCKFCSLNNAKWCRKRWDNERAF